MVAKYNIGDEVFIYNGKIVPRTIKKIRTLETADTFKIGYHFDHDELSFKDSFTDESEVFKSVDDFKNSI